MRDKNIDIDYTINNGIIYPMKPSEEKSPNVLEGVDVSQFQPLDQRSFIELDLRGATIELIYGDEDDRITGTIEHWHDPNCFVIVTPDRMDWVGIPPEELKDVKSVPDLYVQRSVRGMRFRVIGALGPRRHTPGKGLDENLRSTVTAEQIQADIETHRRINATMLNARIVSELGRGRGMRG